MTNEERSNRVETTPLWVFCLLSLALGSATTAALMIPGHPSSEYQRGHSARYHAGWADAIATGNKNIEEVYNHQLKARPKARE